MLLCEVCPVIHTVSKTQGESSLNYRYCPEIVAPQTLRWAAPHTDQTPELILALCEGGRDRGWRGKETRWVLASSRVKYHTFFECTFSLWESISPWLRPDSPVRKTSYSSLTGLHPLNSTVSCLYSIFLSLSCGFSFLNRLIQGLVAEVTTRKGGDPFILLFLRRYCCWLSFR